MSLTIEADTSMAADNSWAYSAVRDSGIIRDSAASMQLDGPTLVRGHALHMITMDDDNAFLNAAPMIAFFAFEPETGEDAKKNILQRMNWEGTLEELPAVIREPVIVTRDVLAASDFTTQDGFNGAFARWKEFRQLVVDEMERDPELARAKKYYTDHEDEIAKIVLRKTDMVTYKDLYPGED